MASRMVMRAMWGALAATFAFCALLAIEAALAVLLLRSVALGWACLIVGGGNLLIALVLGLLAMRNQPSADERAALQLRRDAWSAVKRDLAFTSMLSTILTVWRRSRR